MRVVALQRPVNTVVRASQRSSTAMISTNEEPAKAALAAPQISTAARALSLLKM